MLRRALAERLRPINLLPVRGPFPGILFFRPWGDLVVCLGVTRARHFRGAFTGDLSASFGFVWRLAAKGVPPGASARISRLLSPSERLALVDQALCIPGVEDAWWSDGDAGSIDKFVQGVALALPRFCTEERGSEVRRAAPLIERDRLAREICCRALLPGPSSEPKVRSPAHVRGVGKEFYEAAERVLMRSAASGSGRAGADLVESMATEAWRYSVHLSVGETQAVGNRSRSGGR